MGIPAAPYYDQILIRKLGLIVKVDWEVGEAGVMIEMGNLDNSNDKVNIGRTATTHFG